MKLLWWIFLLPVIGIVAAFAVANRAPVSIDLDPLPLVFDLPLYIALMAAVLAGLIIGGISTWVAGGRWRQEARRLRKNKKLLESEIDGLRSRLAVPVTETPVTDTETPDNDTSSAAALTRQAS